jgi:L-asparagine transporter-like permease
MRHPTVNSIVVAYLFLGFVTELVLQDLAEQEKSDTTKHSLGEKVGRYSASDNVAGNNRFILVLFHGRE